MFNTIPTNSNRTECNIKVIHYSRNIFNNPGTEFSLPREEKKSKPHRETCEYP